MTSESYSAANLIINNEGSTDSLNVTWTPPSGAESQNVSWYLADGDVNDITYYAVFNGSESQYLIEDLTAGALYIVTVTAYNGTNSSSAEEEGRTLPNQVVLSPGGSTTDAISASWDKPAGVVDQYNISCSNGTASPATIDADSDHPVNASCTGLYQAGDEYIMTVTSISGHQTNEASIMLRALPNQVVLRPGIPTNEKVSSSWDKPAGVVDQYNISCSDGTASPATIDADSNHPVNTFCTGLYQAGDEYSMTVTSVSGDQTNEAAVTLFTLPNVVVLVEGISTTDSVSATWVNPPGLVSSYAIECSNGTANPPSINVTAEAQYTASCEGLPVPGANYTMTVTSFSNGQNNMADIILTSVPLPPNLQPNVSTETSVSAVWRHPGGVMETFEVKCSDGVPGDISEDYLGDQDLYQASCENVSTPGDTYLMTVTSISGRQENSATVNLTALPEAVTLREEASNTTAISASWEVPDSVLDTFIITCSDGSASPSEIPDTSDERGNTLTASCTDLPTPGEEYNITVVSRSNGEESAPSSLRIIALPEAVTLREDSSNTTAITASWVVPDSVLDTFIITCSDGSASPSEISVTNDQRGETLTASCIYLTTRGEEYNITVVSLSNGKESAPSSLGIIALPEAVTLREEASNTTAITASWEVPGSVLDTFIITCSDGSASPSEISVTNDQRGETLTASCIYLTTPGEEYNITVVSLSNGKESAPSSLGIIALPEAVTLREEASNTTAITASWEVPGSVLDTFIITCSDGSASPSEISVTNDQRGETLTASCIYLTTPGEEYNITVVSLSNGKESAPSSLGIIALPEAVTLREEASNTTAITASWEVPGSVLDTFIITCSDGSASPSEISVTNDQRGETLTASCIYLTTPGEEYNITVVSLSNGKESAPSSLGIIALPEAVTLREEASNTTAITASWEVPGSVLDTFIITCSDGSASPSEISITSDQRGETLTASCIDLPTPGDEYTITVVSVSRGKESDSSSLGIIAVPEAVTLREESSSTTAITASWEVPDSVLDTFIITCSNGSASPSEISVTNDQRGDTFTASCIDLPTPGEEYTITVVSVSRGKESLPSSLGIIALPNGVELREGDSTTTSVSARWQKQNETADNYKISCSEGRASPPNIRVEDHDLGPFNASCVNLPRPGAVYTMIVFSLVEGTSNSSSTIHLRAVPESVESETIGDYNATAVNVEWTLKNCDCVYDEFSLTYEPDGTEPIIVAHSNQMTYFAEVTGLTQGRQYIFTVVTISGDGASGPSIQTSEEKTVQQRTIPAMATNLVITPDQRQLDLKWTRADGETSGYDITVDPNEGQATFNGNLTHPGGTVSGLTPGTDYTVTVVTVSQDERSEGRVESSRTLTDKPSQVQNPVAEAVNKNTIRVTWEQPAQPNGEITEYRIECVGTREPHDNDIGSDTTTDTSIDITNLTPGFSYTFTMIAVNDGGYSSDPASTDSVETPEEDPPPVDPDYDYGSITEPTGVSITSFTVTLPEDLFSHENGELTAFTVIISEIELDASRVSGVEYTYNDARAVPDSGSYPPYIATENQPYPYPPNYGGRKRRATVQLDMTVGEVDIGVESCPTGTTGYCNGPLKDNTEYYYAFRAYNGAGAVNSATFGPVATAAPNGLLIGAAVGIPLAVIGIIAITACLVRRTKKTPGSDLTAAKTDDIALQEGRYSDRGVADNEEV
ncbi:receptor-type tyrosine-protein phosphatase beta-like [Diadema antillarum]|uniref:receptor-type tyrosine-protein phosphatase beta-like n=1 Tax=Diadema antillarum TaxID=105358 RepID=UPI003A897005